MTKRFCCFLFLFAIMLASAGAALVQEGGLRGKVTDKDSGKPVVNATLLLEGTHHQATTDADGEFVLLGIWPETYSARLSAAGYGDLVMADIRIHAFITTTANFELVTGTEQKLAFSAGTEKTFGQTGT
ncbi:MAG: carboxypeptidase-like regulatory domain-containing protein, partial [bacterium]